MRIRLLATWLSALGLIVFPAVRAAQSSETAGAQAAPAGFAARRVAKHPASETDKGEK